MTDMQFDVLDAVERAHRSWSGGPVSTCDVADKTSNLSDAQVYSRLRYMTAWVRPIHEIKKGWSLPPGFARMWAMTDEGKRALAAERERRGVRP